MELVLLKELILKISIDNTYLCRDSNNFNKYIKFNFLKFKISNFKFQISNFKFQISNQKVQLFIVLNIIKIPYKIFLNEKSNISIFFI